MNEAMNMNKEPKEVFCDDDVPLAMAYVRFQKWGMLYDDAVGLERGTIFRQLDKPFIGEEAVCRG